MSIGRQTEITKRLLRAFNAATAHDVVEGIAWYPRRGAAVAELAERYSIDVEVAAAVVAVISPRLRWAHNLPVAERAIDAHLAGMSVPAVGGCLGTNLWKADAILRGDARALQGNKVERFAANLLGNLEVVTVDSHATYTALGRSKDTLTDNQYRTIERAFQSTAERVGLAPAELQATLWVAKRGTPD